jgi:hypothetical protein
MRHFVAGWHRFPQARLGIVVSFGEQCGALGDAVTVLASIACLYFELFWARGPRVALVFSLLQQRALFVVFG